jgi:hypothetical protein
LLKNNIFPEGEDDGEDRDDSEIRLSATFGHFLTFSFTLTTFLIYSSSLTLDSMRGLLMIG